MTQLFWKGFLIECWLTDGKTSKIRYYDAFSEKVVEVDQSQVVSVYDHPVFVEIERLIDTQNALEEEMKELLLQKRNPIFFALVHLLTVISVMERNG